ncbi:MAG: glycosyltransferase [Thermoplasmatales archaeon]|nr:MAG: glycosyltransferase [Thermoplasmatales archaeon]
MKNIGILEVHCHVKFLHTIAKICKTKETNVTIFTTKDLFSRLENYLENKEEYNVVLKKDKEGLNSFLKQVEKICNEKIDLLFINTLQLSIFYLPRFFGFHPRSKMIMTVHTANAWLKQKPVFNLRKLDRTIDTNLSSLIASKIILPRFDAINVIYPPIKDYILEETNYNKKIFTLPFNFFNETKKTDKKENKKIQFVIPGQIEEHRREYRVLIDAFEKLYNNYNEKFNLYLLGYPVGNYGKQILKRCKRMKKKGYNVFTFDTFVPEEEYDEIISNSDFIISPIRVKTRGMGEIQEIYGVTKGSATVYEAIQYAKPLIVPEEFNMVNELKSSTIKYSDSEDLAKTLMEFIDDRKKILDFKQAALKNSKSFSLEILQEYFIREILNKLDRL